jgi:UDP-glucose 4-epimerase
MTKEYSKLKLFQGCNVLVTGGLGFVGSNLAHRLVKLGANVTLVDAMLPLYGGNTFNLEGINDKVKINYCDIRDRPAMDYLIKGQDFIFHLAGQVSHVDSILDPFNDVDINVNGTLVILEAMRKFNPSARLIFTGTRGQYGASIKIPVDELAPTNPKGMYAITNLAAEKMILMYYDVHDIKGVSLRITNTYGPRHHMKHNRYGVANWFLRLAMDDQTIPLMGSGEILRDYMFIDDLIEALIKISLCENAYGEVFNVGNGVGISFKDLAQSIISLTGTGRIKFIPFSPERKILEPGDYVGDYSKIKQIVGWEATTDLINGFEKTLRYYEVNREHYWKPDYQKENQND